MTFRHRISTIYRKELVDILRDRRTLIAMIVVPIVLYPLLMLGSVQAVSYQAETLEIGPINIGVVGETQRARLTAIIQQDDADLQRENQTVAQPGGEMPAPARSLIDSKIVEFNSRAELEKTIHERQLPVGVILQTATSRQVEAEILADTEEPRGNVAQRRLADLFQRVNEREKRRSGFVEPYTLEFVELSSPSSILGAVLPLILVLMTITGAIYPAIDLTAGERERGTLESLMVCPVRVFDLIVGKFLVVTTVAIMGAALNLTSVTATVYFGGFRQMIGTEGSGLPIGTMAFILISLIPFAVLMSAIMIAVCSYARTFKEAQNYVTPVILAVLIPGGIAAFPATRLEGLMLVMPVGNMVALAKELLLGATVPALSVALVLISTTLYASAAIAVAAGIFGRESVVFADAGSLRGSIRRKHLKPSDRPSITMGLLLVALLFPAWFFVQSSLSPAPDHDARPLLYASAWLMPLMFVGLPIFVMWYWKVDVANGLSLRAPAARHVGGALLIGLSAWVLAHEVSMLQKLVLGTPEALVRSNEELVATLQNMSIFVVAFVISLVPALSEEFLFRGFLLNAVGPSAGKWLAIPVTAAVFAAFHFFVFRFPVTFGLGVVLGYICWQAGAIIPSMIVHFLHNLLSILIALRPAWFEWALGAGAADAQEWAHLPVPVIAVGSALFVAGILLARGSAGKVTPG
jgi:ABC-2 type transport system permease protein/sodium transport system permease protein